jgi:hypothetical protein
VLPCRGAPVRQGRPHYLTALIAFSAVKAKAYKPCTSARTSASPESLYRERRRSRSRAIKPILELMRLRALSCLFFARKQRASTAPRKILSVEMNYFRAPNWTSVFIICRNVKTQRARPQKILPRPTLDVFIVAPSIAISEFPEAPSHTKATPVITIASPIKPVKNTTSFKIGLATIICLALRSNMIGRP